MKPNSFRLTEVDLINVKNVERGHLNFLSPRGLQKASLLGLYGQNGSGKTALINSLGLLKKLLSGESLPQENFQLIELGKKYAQFDFKFDLSTGEYSYRIFYSFKIRLHKQPITVSLDLLNEIKDATEPQETERIEVFDELLKFAKLEPQVSRMAEVINTSVDSVFGPQSKYSELVGDASGNDTKLIVAKQLASQLSRSFVFSPELLQVISAQARKHKPESQRHISNDVTLILAWMKYYALNCLFVLDTRDTHLSSYQLMELHISYKNATVPLPFYLDRPTLIREDLKESVQATIKGINGVLCQIIPGMTIGVVILNSQLMKDGNKGLNVQLTSIRDGKELPLSCESEGIIKIVSILHLLISVFNNPHVTVAIDELDSGIFEYLLGEILKIIAEQGKGQLIFTSHNLRPLETLRKEFIAFTTTDPLNRYTRLTGVKTTNNLRDFYFRKILLGSSPENIYNPTSNAEIVFALRESAGVTNE